MARTPINAYGRLSMEYTAYGKPHEFRVYVPQFLSDPTVGTFTASGTPASLDELATDLTGIMGPLYQSNSDLAFGAWRGEVHSGSGESFITTVNGTITPASFTPFTTTALQPDSVAEMTWTFRDSNTKLMRLVLLGTIYFGPTVVRYGGIATPFTEFANYVLASNRIVSRSALAAASMVSLTTDTNDGLTRRYRR